MQSKLERDTADALGDIRSALTRNVQSLQALQSGNPTRGVLEPSRPAGCCASTANGCASNGATPRWARSPSPTRRIARRCSPRLGRANAHADVALACANARRVSGPAYSSSYFLPQLDGLGLEVMELCLPQVDRRPAHGLRGGHLFAERDAGRPGRAAADAQPGGLVHRSRRHPAGAARRGAARQPGVHLAAAAGPAGQHHGAAHGQLARRARPVPQRADGAGDGDVDRAGGGAGAAGQGHAAAPARRAGPGRRAGVSQGDGGLAGHRPARARPAGAHHLRQSGLLPDGGLRAGGTAGQHARRRPTGRPSWPGEYQQAPGDPPGRPAGAAARRLRVGVHAQGRIALSRC